MPCLERLSKEGASSGATLALLLATLGLVTLVPAPLALWLAWRELKRDGLTETSRDHARLARTLALLEIALGVLLIAFVIWN